MSTLKVGAIQSPTGNAAMSIANDGFVSGFQQVAIFDRYSNVSLRSAGTFHTRAFDRQVSSTITGSSVDGSGYAVLPVGTYLLHYICNLNHDSSGQLGETLVRLYDHAAGSVVANSYSVRQTQAADSNDAVNLSSWVYATFSSSAALTCQSYSENGAHSDANTFEGNPAAALAASENMRNVIMMAWKFA